MGIRRENRNELGKGNEPCETVGHRKLEPNPQKEPSSEGTGGNGVRDGGRGLFRDRGVLVPGPTETRDPEHTGDSALSPGL